MIVLPNTAKAITDHFRELRQRSGLSMTALAHEMGYKGASSIQRYENASDYKGGYLKFNLLRRLENALVGRGTPPISPAEIHALGGPDHSMVVESAGEPIRKTWRDIGEFALSKRGTLDPSSTWSLPNRVAMLLRESAGPEAKLIAVETRYGTVFINRNENAITAPGSYAISDQNRPGTVSIETFSAARLTSDGERLLMRMDVIGKIVAKFSVDPV